MYICVYVCEGNVYAFICMSMHSVCICRGNMYMRLYMCVYLCRGIYVLVCIQSVHVWGMSYFPHPPSTPFTITINK